MNNLHVRYSFALALTAAFGVACLGDDPAPAPAGSVVPAPFQVYMATGPRAGRFHSPICEYNLKPAVLVFVREVPDADQPVVELLKKLDALVAKYPAAHLGACAIVREDGGYRKALQAPLEDDKKVADLTLTAATLAREGLEAKLKELAEKANFQHVTLGLAGPAELEKYALDPMADVTVLLVHHLKIVAKHDYPKGGLKGQAVDAIVRQVEAVAQEAAKPPPRKL
jgi:hypothetical protein